LTVRPWVIELREAMLDAELRAGQIEGVGAEWLSVREELLDFTNAPSALRRGELKPGVREDRVNAVGHVVEAPQEVCRQPARRVRVELGEGKLAHPVDRDEQIELAPLGPHLREVDVDVPKRISYELEPRRGALNARQPADPVALEEAMKA